MKTTPSKGIDASGILVQQVQQQKSSIFIQDPLIIREINGNVLTVTTWIVRCESEHIMFVQLQIVQIVVIAEATCEQNGISTFQARFLQLTHEIVKWNDKISNFTF